MTLNNVFRGLDPRIAFGIITIILLLASSAGAVDVNACTTISSPGEYVLITGLSSSSTCITIASRDVVFDGAGHTITGGGTGGSYGIYVSSGTTNVTVKNLTVINWETGIYYLNVRNGNLLNNTANSNSGYGISLVSGNNNTLIGNTANSNSGYGIYIRQSNNNTLIGNNASNNIYGIYFSSSSNNTIYNNLFNNSNNAILDGSNTWNTTKTAGTNIIGGSYIAGNFWANPDGNGFSQTCTPTMDGICETNYLLASDNVDYLPLAAKVQDTVPPTTTITLSGTAGNSGWNTSNVSVTLTAIDNDGGSGVNKTEFSFDGANWIIYTGTFTVIDEGITTIQYNSTDNAGNVETTKKQTIKIDKTPPVITFRGLATVNLNSASSVLISVEDSISGVAYQSAPNGNSTLDTSTVGNKTFTVTAQDNAGNEASSTYTYRVIYDFMGAGGFQPPIKNTDINKAKVGKVVPVKWRLPDGKGGFIGDRSVVEGITYSQASCSDFSTSHKQVPAATSGKSGLRYDSKKGAFIYNWKTPNIRGCYVLTLRLNDGSEYPAKFQLK